MRVCRYVGIWYFEIWTSCVFRVEGVPPLSPPPALPCSTSCVEDWIFVEGSRGNVFGCGMWWFCTDEIKDGQVQNLVVEKHKNHCMEFRCEILFCELRQTQYNADFYH